MKKIVQLSIIAIATISMSCGENAEVKPSSESESVSDSIIVETVEVVDLPDEKIVEVVESKFHYDEDWNRFKEAVINKDIPGVSAFASSDMIDSEVIVDAFGDPEFLELLKNATYNDLTTDTEGPEVLLVFSAAIAGEDEDGNVYESGLYLYFSQGETGLLLENFLAAG